MKPGAYLHNSGQQTVKSYCMTTPEHKMYDPIKVADDEPIRL